MREFQSMDALGLDIMNYDSAGDTTQRCEKDPAHVFSDSGMPTTKQLLERLTTKGEAARSVEQINEQINEQLHLAKKLALTNRQLRIAMGLKNNPRPIYDALSTAANVSLIPLRSELSEMREECLAHRVGSRKNGHWEVLGRLEEGAPHE